MATTDLERNMFLVILYLFQPLDGIVDLVPWLATIEGRGFMSSVLATNNLFRTLVCCVVGVLQLFNLSGFTMDCCGLTSIWKIHVRGSAKK